MSGEEESESMEAFPTLSSVENDDDIKIEEEFIEWTASDNKIEQNNATEGKETKFSTEEETKPASVEVQENLPAESVQDNTENLVDKNIEIDNATTEDSTDSGDKENESVNEIAEENENVGNAKNGNKGDFEMIEEAKKKNDIVDSETGNKGNSEDDIEMIEETSTKSTLKTNDDNSEKKEESDSEDDIEMIEETSTKSTLKMNDDNNEKKGKSDFEDDIEMIEETSTKSTLKMNDDNNEKKGKNDFEDDDEIVEEACINNTVKKNGNIGGEKKNNFEDTEEVIEETCVTKTVKEIQNIGDFEDDEEVIEEARVTKVERKSQVPPNIPISKDSSTFRMHLTTEEIDKMINDGTLEKVGHGHYRVRPESVKNLKSTPLALAKELDLKDRTSNTIPVSDTVANNIPVAIQEPTTNVLGTSVAAALTPAQIAALPLVQQTPLIALMPVNQVAANAKNNAFIALPMQQSSTTIAYSPNLPTFVAISQTSTPTPTQTTVSTSLIPTASEIQVVPSAKTVLKPETSIAVSKSTPNVATSMVVSMSSPTVASSMVVSKSTPSVMKSSTSDESLIMTSDSSDISPKVFNVPVISGVKRKPLFDTTKVKKPYKFAKLADKPKRKSSLHKIVSDINTSDEEEDGGLSKCKTYGAELASMFFKKAGEPKTTNKSLLDKLHKAIFNDSDSDQESNNDSEIEEIIEKVKTGKADHHVVNCPGPSKYEALIGPENNSKLSIVRCQEVRHTKNAAYELYKVKVISAGREANTNILIPIPEGYKLNFPSKPKEEPVEFSHTPHEDYEELNRVSPLFLEKLAKAELKLRKYKDQIKVLRGRYIELLQEYSNRPQFSTISDLVGSAAKFLTEDQLVFFLMQLKAGAHNMQGIRYSVREKVLSLAIYQKSPEVYKWISKLFNLPSKRILDQWLEEVGSQDPKLLKKLMYHIYVSYNFKPDA